MAVDGHDGYKTVLRIISTKLTTLLIDLSHSTAAVDLMTGPQILAAV